MAEVYVPLKVVASRAKTIVGPYARIGRGAYLMLSIVRLATSTRLEPHILWDPPETLGDSGLKQVTGPVALVRERGLRQALASSLAAYKHLIYLPPWGAPLLIVDAVDDPDASILEAISDLDLEGLYNSVKAAASAIRVVEE